MKTTHTIMMTLAAAIAITFAASSPAADATRLKDNKDGTITDTRTGLMWTKAISFTKRTISQAKDFASTADIAGHKDWRVSTRQELEEIARIYPDYCFLELQNGEYLTDEESRQRPGSIYVIGIYPKDKPYTGEGYTENAKTRQYVVYYNGSKNYRFYYWLVRTPEKTDADKKEAK